MNININTYKIKNDQDFYEETDKLIIDNKLLYYNKIYTEHEHQRKFILFILKSHYIYKRIGDKYNPNIENIQEFHQQMQNPFMKNIIAET